MAYQNSTKTKTAITSGVEEQKQLKPMPTRKNSIDALLSEIKSELPNIESLYKESLKIQTVPDKLKIKVKNFLENARSAMDYAARDIADTLSIATDHKVYFPVVNKDKNAASFQGSAGKNLPGLETANVDLYSYLESIQPYHSGNEWFGFFVELNNSNKHNDLTPQTRTETVRIESRSIDGGGSVSWDPSSVKFGSGVYINGAFVNPTTQMPIPTANTVVTKQVWVDFLLDNEISALRLLHQIKEKMPQIIDKVYSKI